MVPRLVPEIEGGYPERDGEEGGEEEEGEEGLVLENSRSWIHDDKRGDDDKYLYHGDNSMKYLTLCNHVNET